MARNAKKPSAGIVKSQQSQALLREEISKIGLLAQIQLAMRYLSLGWGPTYHAPDRDEATPSLESLLKVRVTQWEKLSREDINRYSLLLKTAVGLLGKLLPDLRAVELTDNAQVRKSLSDIELAQRIAGVINQPETSQGVHTTMNTSKYNNEWMN